MTRLRGLGARRLSNRTDESTSIERQGEQIDLCARSHEIDLVGLTEDSDVSGAISPFVRKDLGPWLTDPAKIAQWDVLIVAKLDRLTRSIIHFHELVSWLDRNGKSLISVAESLDLSTSVGRMFANLLAMFAQFERERASERRKEAYELAKRNGWYDGGRYPYGYRPVKVDSHWELEEHPENAATLRWIADQVLKGESRSSIARALKAKGIPAPFGGETWSRDTVARVLQRSSELLDESIRASVLYALDSTKHSFTRRGNGHMMLNVGFCAKCKQPLYAQRGMRRAQYYYEHYYCKARCGARLIPMQELDEIVSESLLETFSWVPMMEKTIVAGYSPKAELDEIDKKLRQLDFDDPDWRMKQDELLAERDRLKDARTEPDEIGSKPTGETLAGYWPKLDKAARRLFLLENGIKFYAKREADGELSVVIGPDPATFEGGEFFQTVHALSTLPSVTL
jgi:DNA invertase Pin-like site-specific DNA recombinase